MKTPRTSSEPAARRTNVARGPSSFVGRADDLANVRDAFTAGARLVTLNGLGGMGKTRLALRFAEEELDTYCAPGGGGVWFCDLTAAEGEVALTGVVASTLGEPLSRSTDGAKIARELGRAIARRKEVLVVLDNFEQLVGVAEPVLAGWVAEAPRARFLVTSRVALGLDGEHVVPLAPLPVPREAASDDELGRADAIQLFVRRARQVRPGFETDPKQLAAIADIVRRVDGIPLAIELAAARIAVLSVSQLRDRLARPLDVLVRHGDDGRHASMRRTIVESVAFLDATARRLLATSTVFAGPFGLNALDAIFGSDALPALEVLVSHGLVQATACPDLDGELRFSTFVAIREHVEAEIAPRSLDDPERGALRDRHAAWFAAEAERVLTRADAPPDEDADVAAARLARDLDDLAAAHAHLLATDRPAGALAIALALDPLLSTRGHFRLRLRLLDSGIVAALGGHEARPDRTLAAALLARGRAHAELGDLVAARRDLDAGGDLASRIGAADLEALRELRLGELGETEGDTVGARVRYQAALDKLADDAPPTARSRGRAALEADLQAHVAHTWRREGNVAEATRAIAIAIDILRRADDPQALSLALYEAAVIALFAGEDERARSLVAESLSLARRGGARLAEGALLSLSGILRQERGELALAIAEHVEAVEIFRALGNPHREASALTYLAGATLERGQAADARLLYERALSLAAGVGAARYEALTSAALAVVEARAGSTARAEERLARARVAASQCAAEATLAVTLDVHALHVAASARSDRSVSADARDRAAALVASHPCDDTRFALRLFDLPAAPSPSIGATRALVVRAAGRAFRAPETDEDVDLSTRKPLRRLLLALAERRVSAPGEGMSVEDLVRAGWPGERMRGSAGTNRVHVALNALRKLGLRGLLVTGRHGYALSAAVACVVEPETTRAESS